MVGPSSGNREMVETVADWIHCAGRGWESAACLLGSGGKMYNFVPVFKHSVILASDILLFEDDGLLGEVCIVKRGDIDVRVRNLSLLYTFNMPL